jgi:hypothetical protein
MDNRAVEQVRAQFAALLWEPVLEPLERVFGPYGAIALQGFTDALAQAMEQPHE